MAERKILYSWRPEGFTEDEMILHDIHEEWRVVSLDRDHRLYPAPMRIAIKVWCRGEWTNPWSSRPLVWHLLTKLQDAEAEVKRLREMRDKVMVIASRVNGDMTPLDIDDLAEEIAAALGKEAAE